MNVAIEISEWQGDDISPSGYHCTERALSPVFRPVALLEWSNHRLTIWTKCDVRKRERKLPGGIATELCVLNLRR